MSIQCKYLMPCGRCEKLGGPCDAKKDNNEKPDKLPILTNKPCLPNEHRWLAIGMNTYSTTYECENCHTTITMQNGTYPY